MQANPYQAPTADLTAAADAGGTDESSPFSPSGRFGRLSYMAWSLLLGMVIWVFMIVVLGVSISDGADTAGVLRASGAMALVGLAALVPAVIFTVRRLHDFGAAGWWSLLLIVPVVSAVFALVLLFRAGNPEANRFAPPRVTRAWEKVLGYIFIGVMVLAIIGIIAAIAIPLLAAR